MAMQTLFFYIRIITVTLYVIRFLYFILLHFRPAKPTSLLVRYKHGKEPWALITGASDGIGYGFAQELARLNFGIVLHGRNQTKLESAAGALSRAYSGAKIRFLVVDAMTDDEAKLEVAIATVRDLNITILINNVGGFPAMRRGLKPLAAFNASEIDNFIYLNARFLARITNLMIPLLSHRTGRSLILNVSSGAHIGIPYLVMYSAVKGFVNSFGRALSREFKAEKVPVDVVVLTPGDTRSGSHSAELGWNVPDSRTLARKAVESVGGRGGSLGMVELCPFWVHDLLLRMLDAVPEWARQAALVDEMRRKIRTLEKGE